MAVRKYDAVTGYMGGCAFAPTYHLIMITSFVYLLNGGLLEYAQQKAAHKSVRTTKLYDRRNDQVTLDRVERIVL
jgi:hypothetical protein